MLRSVRIANRPIEVTRPSLATVRTCVTRLTGVGQGMMGFGFGLTRLRYSQFGRDRGEAPPAPRGQVTLTRGRRGIPNSRIPPRAARERSFIYDGMYEYMLMLRVSTTVAQGPGAGMCSVMHRRETTEMAARVDAQLRRTQREWDAHLTRVLSCRWSSPPTARSSTSPCPQRGTPLQLSRLISSLPPQRLCCAAAALGCRFTLRRSLHVYLKYMKPSSSFCTETVVLRQIQRSRM